MSQFRTLFSQYGVTTLNNTLTMWINIVKIQSNIYSNNMEYNCDNFKQCGVKMLQFGAIILQCEVIFLLFRIILLQCGVVLWYCYNLKHYCHNMDYCCHYSEQYSHNVE